MLVGGGNVVESIPIGPVEVVRIKVLADIVRDSGQNLLELRRNFYEADNQLPRDLCSLLMQTRRKVAGPSPLRRLHSQ